MATNANQLAKSGKFGDLRRRVVFLLLALVVYRVGAHIPVPGIDPVALQELFKSQAGGILNLFNMFSGGALSRFTVFALGIMPYISASIIMQLLTFSFPTLKQLQKEGEGGRRKLNQYTRYATLVICTAQAAMAAVAILNFQKEGVSIVSPEYTRLGFIVQSTLVITTGSMVLLWLAEQITKFGIGNGVSIIIMIGILSSIPGSFAGFDGQLPEYLGIALISILIIGAIVAMVQAVRKINLEQQRRIQGNKVYGGASTVLPLKLNQANVVPVIFASPVMYVLAYFASLSFIQMEPLFVVSTPGYRYAFAALIIAFTYFYISITFDLNELSNHFKQSGFFVRGIKPGKKTVDFLAFHLKRITFVGAVFLAAIAIVPDLIGQKIGAGQALMGGTGLLIVVGVALDVMQKVASFFLAHQYQGLTGGNDPGAGAAAGKKAPKRF